MTLDALVNRSRNNPGLAEAALILAAERGIRADEAHLLMRDASDAVYLVEHPGARRSATTPMAASPTPVAPPPAAACPAIDLDALTREAQAIARQRGMALSEAYLVAGGLPAGAGPTDGTSPRWWADSAALDAEARALQQASGQTYRRAFHEITERHALADRRAAAATFRERQERANAGDQVARRMAELQAGGMAAKPALLQAGRELAGAGAR
jgi:hypothetical protein